MPDLLSWEKSRGEITPRLLARGFRREFKELMNQFIADDWPVERYLGGTVEPAMDISENDEEIIINAELPGMKPEDLNVNVAGDMLTISGEKKEKKEKKAENTHWIERSFGTFSRFITLPSEIQHDRAEAKYVEGVLILKLPKSEPPQ